MHRVFRQSFFNADGRSDYATFMNLGVPVSALATGAEGIKTAAQREVFGGIAQAAYDTCYHQECDDLFNFDKDVLLQNTLALAAISEELALRRNVRSFLSGSDSRVDKMAEDSFQSHSPSFQSGSSSFQSGSSTQTANTLPRKGTHYVR